MKDHKALFVILLLLSYFELWALPQENPLQPNAIGNGLFLSKENYIALKGGYQGDVTWNASFKTEKGGSANVNHYHIEMHMGRLFVNILNQFELYGFGGAAKGEFSHRPAFDGRRRKYKTTFHPIWGAGLRFIAFYWKNATLGFDGKYLTGNLPIYSICIDKRCMASDGRWKVRRWQGAGALSYQLYFFVPYIGVRYSEVKDEIRNVKKAQLKATFFDLKNRHRFGGSAGFGLFPGNYYSLSFEWRFYDEEAFSATFDFKF